MMDDDRFSGLAGYERYFRYMRLMDTMDMMERFCDSSLGESNEPTAPHTNPYKRQKVANRSRLNSDTGKGSDEENDSENNFESDNDSSEESDLENDSFEPPKKKIDLENPYRGLRDSGNPLETMTDNVFLTSYKFSKKTVFDVMELIKGGLIKHTNRGSPVPPLIELLITLKYLTTGSVQKDAMDGVSQSTISRINTRVTKLIVALQNKYINFPGKVDIDRNKMRYYERGKFPEVVGCIGSTHVGVRVKGIRNYNSGFVNENGYHSVRVQVITGPDSEILDIVSRWPGSTHENKIFNVCEINQKFLTGEIQGVLLGNYAYNPTTVIMTCVKRSQHTGEYYYNEALNKTYMAGECILEWKRRFKCLQTFLACKPHTQQNIILCCAILHNIAKLNNDPLPIADAHAPVSEVKGKKDFSKKRIEIPVVENSAYIARDEFIRKHFPVHRLMLKDTERMVAYKTAIMNNKSYISGKTVMDVGAGSGILSIFCAMAGAKKVYAIEASNIAKLASDLVKENNLDHIIEVIHKRVEDVILPDDEKVDMIISEWMGFYLLHEGMLDSVFCARDKFLKPDGSMFPESATVYVAPCSVPSMYEEWDIVQGVNMNVFAAHLRKNKNSKPEVMEIKEEHLMGETTALAWINTKEDRISDLNDYSMNTIIGASRNGRYQGICLWFDCQFPSLGEVSEPVILSTSPSCPQTHWKQTVIVLPEEQILEEGEPIAWNLVMKRSEDSSRRYDLQLMLLDPLVETHPTPCSCYMTKCIVIRKFMDEQEGEHVGISKDDFHEELDDSLD